MSETKRVLDELQAALSRVQALIEEVQEPSLPPARLPDGHQPVNTETLKDVVK